MLNSHSLYSMSTQNPFFGKADQLELQLTFESLECDSGEIKYVLNQAHFVVKSIAVNTYVTTGESIWGVRELI